MQGKNGKWHYTMFVQNGRVKDVPGYPLRTGLRELAKVLKGDFRFTANQNLIIANVDEQVFNLCSTFLFYTYSALG